MTNLFKYAAISKLRFPSVRGDLTVEQLWDLPLESKTGFDLDSVAKAVNKDLKSQAEESFVATTSNPAKGQLEAKLEIVKEVIADKIAASEARRLASARSAERQKLLDILHSKKVDELQGMSVEELEKRISELDNSLS